MSGITVWQALMRAPWRFLLSSWPWRALAYLLVSVLLAGALGILAIVTLLLLPLWGIALGSLERRRTRWLGFPAQPSGHVRIVSEQRHNWLGIRMTEAATWRACAALLVDILAGAVALVVLFFEGMAVVVLIAIGVAGAQSERAIGLFGEVTIVVGADSWWLIAPLVLVVLVLFAYVNAILAAGQAVLLRGLYAPRQQELSRHVERLVRSRAALVDAFENERRRIERDLHDGVQQELVALAARLGIVSVELEDLARTVPGAEPVRAALDAAQEQAERAMSSLRDTVRGIHPAVLADRGLPAALNELAERAPVRVRVEAEGIGRLPGAIEAAAYYVVTETVSNAAKHTTARHVDVRARLEEESLRIQVRDDGHGGADESAGTGLRGLRERAETLGGRFRLHSPLGGPTTVEMTIPTHREERG